MSARLEGYRRIDKASEYAHITTTTHNNDNNNNNKFSDFVVPHPQKVSSPVRSRSKIVVRIGPVLAWCRRTPR